jgi:hypothetical protein
MLTPVLGTGRLVLDELIPTGVLAGRGNYMETPILIYTNYLGLLSIPLLLYRV